MNVVVMMFVDIKSVDFDGILWEVCGVWQSSMCKIVMISG